MTTSTLPADGRAPAPAGGGRGTGAAEEPPPSRTATRILGSVVAPATLVGALLYFFGRLHATSFFAYFGVHFTVLDFDTLAYVVRSQDGLFLPLATAAMGTLVTLWVRRGLGPRLPLRVHRMLSRTAKPLAAVVGATGLSIAFVGVVIPTAFADPIVAPGLGLAAGAALLTFATHAGRSKETRVSTSSIVEWVAVYVVVGVGLFWAVGNYSASLGASRAHQFDEALETRPGVTLISDEDLGLTGVRSVTCAGGTAVHYDGLVLVLQAGGHYLLLPRDWTRHDGSAILLPRSDGLRLEFRAQPRVGTESPSGC